MTEKALFVQLTDAGPRVVAVELPDGTMGGADSCSAVMSGGRVFAYPEGQEAFTGILVREGSRDYRELVDGEGAQGKLDAPGS